METKDFGRLFVIRSTMSDEANKALVFFQPTFELDPPYRYSNSLVIRLRHKQALMVGWWTKSPASSLVEHFRMALSLKLKGHKVPVKDPHFLFTDDAVQRAENTDADFRGLPREEQLRRIAEGWKDHKTQGGLSGLGLDSEAF
jgi:hypothetical protein